METAKKSSRVKKSFNSKNPLGKYRSMDELSDSKIESAKNFVANIDMRVFKENGRVE